MARIVLLPTPTPDGRRIVLRAEVRTPRDRLRRLAAAITRRLRTA
jgi:hypothetical protein